jgi:hypothetical protein
VRRKTQISLRRRTWWWRRTTMMMMRVKAGGGGVSHKASQVLEGGVGEGGGERGIEVVVMVTILVSLEVATIRFWPQTLVLELGCFLLAAAAGQRSMMEPQ